MAKALGRMNKKEIPLVQVMAVDAGKFRYAIASASVQEIMTGEKIHPLPFVPRYIEGVLNCRGEAWTVLNPVLLIDGADEEIQGNQFLLIKRSDDRFCLHISTAETFFSVPETELAMENITFKSHKIRLISPDAIEERLLKDLEC